MNAAPRMILLTLALTSWAAADLPKKAPITKYTRLWTDSPFTSKPPPPEVGPTVNPLEDWTLVGVSPVASGYRVTLLNKKEATKRVIVESDRPAEGFKILAVTRQEGNPLGTVVRMSSGSTTGTVAFEEKYLALAPPPAPKVAPKLPPGLVPGQIPGQIPGQAPGQASSQRQPRPRVVPPPAPTLPASPQQSGQRTFSRGGTPSTSSSSSSHSRPDRRGR